MEHNHELVKDGAALLANTLGTSYMENSEKTLIGCMVSDQSFMPFYSARKLKDSTAGILNPFTSNIRPILNYLSKLHKSSNGTSHRLQSMRCWMTTISQHHATYMTGRYTSEQQVSNSFHRHTTCRRVNIPCVIARKQVTMPKATLIMEKAVTDDQ